MGTFKVTPTDICGNPIGPTRNVFVPDEGATPTGPDVPEGSIRALHAWVGYDSERAQRVIVAEHARDHSVQPFRPSLIRSMERLLAPTTTPSGASPT